VAINEAIKFDICLVDGNVVTGSGVKGLGLVMASEDPVAIDSAAARIAGINPYSIRYLKLASKAGLGNINFGARGMPIRYFKERYPRRTAKSKLMSKAFELVSILNLGGKLGLE